MDRASTKGEATIMSAASNTKDCFREFVGKKLIGLLFDTAPLGHADLAGDTKTMIFDDGRGLTIANNGSFWIESAEEVGRAVGLRKTELQLIANELAEVISLSGLETRL